MKAKALLVAAMLLAIWCVFAQTQSEVYFGVYVEDLDFPQAHDLGYKYLYGILITGVVEGSPAEQAGIRANDILMEIDDAPVTDLEEFDRLRAGMKAGGEVSLRIWRDEEITDIPMVLQPRPETGKTIREEIRKEVYIDDGQSAGKGKKDYGWGGGSWIPYWFIFPVHDVNELIDRIGDPPPSRKGFGSNAITGKGVFMQGGAGKGHLGNGIFIGGVGAGYEYEVTDAETNTSLSYEVSFAGVTLEKRIPITRGFAMSLGAMLGGGGHELKYSSTQSNFTWPVIFTGENFTATLKREYFVVQPRAELIVRLVDWLSLRAEAGYVFGIPTHDGWKVDAGAGDDFPVAGSPNTPFKGISFSIGPWIGF